MRYFHRTSLPIAEALQAADTFFAGRLSPGNREAKRRTYGGAIGKVAVTVQADGGHYTLIIVDTDQVGESELDKLAKRFLVTVHTRVHAAHEVRGAY
jgi:hypothetical protein